MNRVIIAMAVVMATTAAHAQSVYWVCHGITHEYLPKRIGVDVPSSTVAIVVEADKQVVTTMFGELPIRQLTTGYGLILGNGRTTSGRFDQDRGRMTIMRAPPGGQLTTKGTSLTELQCSPAQLLSWWSVGSVRLGMTVAEAELVLNAKLAPVSLPFSKECYVTGRTDGKDEALSYVIENGRIVVITVRQPSPNIVDTHGIAVGSTESDIRRGYKLVEKVPAPQGTTTPEPSPQYWIVAENPDHQRAIIFQTQDEKALYMRTGLKPQVMSSEDCS